MESLYSALGGEPGIESLVDSLYAKVLADPELGPFFEGLDMGRQRTKFRAFLQTVTGGPAHRSGIELRAAHSVSVAQGLAEHHVDAFLGHLRAALAEAMADDDTFRKVIAELDAVRADVLGR